ncbi:hypothetical protein SETIT_5G344500v2 [Setaria italica]|uniref:Uncharacterized protein n=1 Tax=Setaria italica TaxID=4555 RepID=K3XUB5_SETIT|nr:hypothetical protein SETIT_5G344500v2 [Setaria italica]
MRSCSSLVICCGVPRAAAVEGARHRLLPQVLSVCRSRRVDHLPLRSEYAPSIWQFTL